MAFLLLLLCALRIAVKLSIKSVYWFSKQLIKSLLWKEKKKKDLHRHLMKEGIQMAHKLVKWFSTPFVTVLQIKKWWDTTSHLLQGLKIQKIDNTGKVAEKFSSIADGKTKWYEYISQIYTSILYKYILSNSINLTRKFPGGPVIRNSMFSVPRVKVQSLVGELRSCKLLSTARFLKIKKKKISLTVS